jgi:hypothetical protein
VLVEARGKSCVVCGRVAALRASATSELDSRLKKSRDATHNKYE